MKLQHPPDTQHAKSDMIDRTEARYRINPYLDWVAAQGLVVVEDHAVDLFDVETSFWPLAGANSAAVHLQGRGDFANMFVFDIAPGGSTAPQRHLYEDIVYVLEGSGSTQLEFNDGRKRGFEWGAKSLFAVPLNVRHRHFNASGRDRVRLVSTTNLPLVMNTFHDEQFIFGTRHEFPTRLGKDIYYSGEGEFIPIRPDNHLWQTNFVPDITSLELQPWAERGGGGANINMAFPDSIMHAHVSEMPVGSYKKAHRHHPGFHVMCVTGTGFSLLWFEGDADFLRVDWRHGVVVAPADRQFHQHFNTGASPARYLATGVGSIRFPFSTARQRAGIGLKPGEKGADSTSTRMGGDQIEYEDQDPRIQRMWLESLRESGITPVKPA